MITPGVSSITLRRYGIEEVVRYAAIAKLKTIEWSADPHVPHGDLAAAREAAARTVEAGLTVNSYGAYYRCGEPAKRPPFAQVVETARALGAQSIRVWAGRKASRDAPNTYWNAVIGDLKRAAEEAATAGCRVSVAFADHTLNDTPEGWKRLLEGVGPSGVLTYWQPTNATADLHRADVVNEMLRHIGDAHVFVWEAGVRVPLARAHKEWVRTAETLADDPRRDHALLLQLVEKDRPENFLRDAASLLEIIADVR